MTLFHHHGSHNHHSSEVTCPKLDDPRADDATKLCNNDEVRACYHCIDHSKGLVSKVRGDKFHERYPNWNTMVTKSLTFGGDGDLVIWAKKILSKYRDDKTCSAECGPKISAVNDILPILANRDDKMMKIKSFI